MASKAVHAIIRGRVQGVFFRMETQAEAGRQGVTGWVRNLSDGSVETVFEGSSQSVDQMVEWCRQGPPMASVSDVEIVSVPFTGDFADFSIRR